MLLFSEYLHKIPDLLGDAGSTPSRGYAYDQKRSNSPRGEVCPKANISYP
jgi:hypothetical protein